MKRLSVCGQDVMRVLVEAGADVTTEDEQGSTALLNAVKVRWTRVRHLEYFGIVALINND